MRPLLAAALLLAWANVTEAQHRVEFFLDAEGVRRSESAFDFAPGSTVFQPHFDTGWGAGGGIKWFFSDRVSLEAKVAGLATQARVRVVAGDFVGTADLGWAQLYPISGVVQWHPLENAAVRPYLGAGVVYTILRNINKQVGGGATAIEFKDPTGLVLDGGLEFPLGHKWSILADARYVPMETSSHVSFPGTTSSLDMHVRPLIVSFGAAYRP
jgi:outer membrane protein W